MYGDAFFFKNALDSDWYTTLFLIHKEAGYINLFSNISNLINSKIININYAPLFNSYFCFLLLFILIYLILFCNISLFKSDIQKYLIGLIFLIAPSFVFEIWLDALNAQIYLALIVLLILFLEAKNRIELFSTPFILIIAGLSGIYSCLLFPLFLIKYFLNKKISNLINSLILILTSLIQITIVFISKTSGVLSSGKLDFTISSTEFISFSYNILVRTFFSGTLPNYLMSNFENLKEDPNILLLISFLIFSIFIFLLFLFIKRVIHSNKEGQLIFLYLSYFFLSSAILVLIGGVNDGISGRYSVIPGVCLLLIIFILSFQDKKVFLNYIAVFLLITTVGTGIFDFRDKKFITYYDCINCPNWKSEILKLKMDSNYEVAVWPYKENKRIKLRLINN